MPFAKIGHGLHKKTIGELKIDLKISCFKGLVSLNFNLYAFIKIKKTEIAFKCDECNFCINKIKLKLFKRSIDL